jgi:hypothetical protein
MSLRTLFVAITCASAALTGCAKKTEAELAEMERAKIREEKRQEAIKAYSDLAEKFPNEPAAKDAAAKAQKLQALAPKK